MTKDNELFNIAQYLPEMAQRYPFRKAVVFPHSRDKMGRRSYTHLTFQDLNAESDRYAHGLVSSGITRGTRVLLMVKPSLEFISLTFALFKTGAVPILIDPGMGRTRLLECIRNVSPEAVVGIPMVHVARQAYRKYFKSVKINLVIGGKMPLLAKSLEKLSPPTATPFQIADTTRSSPAAILFTTGSTGPAKGVLYEHGMFDAQVALLQKVYGFEHGEVDLAGLPVFALFDVALGMTCVIPDMDPTRPAHVDPLLIIEAVHDQGVTTSFGSPAIWKRVGEYCTKHHIALPSMRRILMAGAPVPGDLIGMFKHIIPNGDVHTPYGATEALPVSSISGAEVTGGTWARSREGFGTCVGKAVPGVTVKIIRILDEPLPEWLDDLDLRPNKIGEIVVHGPMVTETYYNRDDATAKAKIHRRNGVWHRMGDIGYLDDQDRLWFCGRKGHRVITPEETLFTVPCEAIFNRHPKVFRSALVGIGPAERKTPVIIIEPGPGHYPKTTHLKKNFAGELLEIAAAYPHTEGIEHVLFHPSFPVDIRHNAKIFREKLAVWADGKLKGLGRI